MSLSHILTQNWTRSGESITANVTKTADAEDNRDVSVVNGSPVTLNMTIDQSAMVSLFVYSDKAITLDTDGVGQAALTIPADTPLVWHDTMPLTNPITIDATTVTLTATVTAETAAVKIRLLQDATP